MHIYPEYACVDECVCLCVVYGLVHIHIFPCYFYYIYRCLILLHLTLLVFTDIVVFIDQRSVGTLSPASLSASFFPTHVLTLCLVSHVSNSHCTSTLSLVYLF